MSDGPSAELNTSANSKGTVFSSFIKIQSKVVPSTSFLSSEDTRTNQSSAADDAVVRAYLAQRKVKPPPPLPPARACPHTRDTRNECAEGTSAHLTPPYLT